MTLFIASDIHGSALYAEKMIKVFEREKADRLLLLGDLLYHGPRNELPQGYEPKKVIELLSPFADRITAVRGNCDAEVDQMVLPFSIMADYAHLYINDLLLYATHGHHVSPQAPPPVRERYVLVNGHTHVPMFTAYADFWYVNPGSVSIPKEQSEHSYIVLRDRTFSWRTLDGVSYMSHTI